MNSIKYIGLDVHQSTISVAVLDGEGKLVMQCVLGTQASAILDFFQGQRGTLHVTCEEGTHSAWLYDLLVRRVTQLVVCNPRKNALLKAGNKSDAIDARKLAELLRAGLLSPVYHGQNSTAAVKHLGLSYAALTEDTTRTMGRLKALYRSQGRVARVSRCSRPGYNHSAQSHVSETARPFDKLRAGCGAPGNIYGMASAGGASGVSVCFSLSGQNIGAEVVLRSFSGGSDGSGRVSALLADGGRQLLRDGLRGRGQRLGHGLQVVAEPAEAVSSGWLLSWQTLVTKMVT